LKTGRFLHIQ